MSSRYDIRKAYSDDSERLLELIRLSPQEGSIKLNFERKPDYFYATHTTTSDSEVWVMEDTSKNILIAVFSIGKRLVYLNGHKQWVRYGSDLRIHPDYQGGRMLYRLFQCYKTLVKNDWMQTVILEENDKSINTVSSGRLSLPNYFPFGRIITYSIDCHKNIKSSVFYSVRRASVKDIPLMQEYFNQQAALKQFYPYCDFSKIESQDGYYRDMKISDMFLVFNRNELVGMCGAWDQKGFKQTVFHEYKGMMKFIRLINNALRVLIGGIYLPKPGEIGRYLILHSILVNNNEPQIFESLLSFIQKQYCHSHSDAMTFGFDERDPLNQACKKLKGFKLFSKQYLASYESDPRLTLNQDMLFYPEVGRL